MVFLPVFLSVFFPVARHIALSHMGGLPCLQTGAMNAARRSFRILLLLE